MSFTYTDQSFEVESENVTYSDETITTEYEYRTSTCERTATGIRVRPVSQQYTFETQRKIPKTGVMIVGWGGNNGTTVTAGIMANRDNITWRTKEGVQTPDYFGSLTQASTVRLGMDAAGNELYVPFSSVLPMVRPNDLVIGGWDISTANLGDAMRRAAVLNVNLQDKLYDSMSALQPLPSIYYPDFIAANQSTRADNVLSGSKAEHLETIRGDIRAFKEANGLDKVIVLWSANTERFCDVREGLNDTAENLLAAVARGDDEVSPSTIFCVAAVQEGCSYINGSPQNTFVPGAVELASQQGVFIAGDDFKSGQTKMKSVLVDFLVNSGIKPVSIVSYNHLGNNDGKNLSAPRQFRSKEISKSNVVDDMVACNGLLYPTGDKPDHCVVIKYVPFVGDSKRALDEYTSRIFMGGLNTIAMHNTCEDSLLAAPLIIDLVLLAELAERIRVRRTSSAAATAAAAASTEVERKEGDGEEEGSGFHSVLSLLSFLLKAPLVPEGTPVVNALFKQREAILNTMRACVGLPPDHHMMLPHRLASAGPSAAQQLAADAAVLSEASSKAAAASAKEIVAPVDAEGVAVTVDN